MKRRGQRAGGRPPLRTSGRGQRGAGGTSGRDALPPDRSALAAVLARLDGSSDGRADPDTVPTGFPTVDRLLGGGFRRGDLVVLGGDVASGKSALALAMAIRVAEQGRGALFFVGETSVDRVAERALAIEGRLSIDDIRRGELGGEVRARLDDVAARLRGILPALERMPAGLNVLAEELARRSDVELAIVDPLQMLARGERQQDEELATAVRRLKTTAVDRNVVILATAHLPTLASRPDRRPQLDDFGALGAVKQHADVVLGLFREEMYDKMRDLEGATELHVLKNRSGALGYADLYFYAQWMRFEDLVEPDR